MTKSGRFQKMKNNKISKRFEIFEILVLKFTCLPIKRQSGRFVIWNLLFVI
jgi:hypothetical protein